MNTTEYIFYIIIIKENKRNNNNKKRRRGNSRPAICVTLIFIYIYVGAKITQNN